MSDPASRNLPVLLALWRGHKNHQTPDTSCPYCFCARASVETWQEHRRHMDSPVLIDNCPYCYLPVQEARRICPGCKSFQPYDHRCRQDFKPTGPIYLN